MITIPISVRGLEATVASWRSRGSSRKWPVEDDLHPMVLQMELKMFALRQTIAIFDENSGEANQPMQFQGSTMFSPIITTPLAVEIPTGVLKPHPS